MTSHISHVMTLANSIIGVSVLAMPFCFKQCGIILAIIVLLLCSLLSRLACHFLIKSAVMSRRRNFEFLAFHAFGHMGKFFVELFIIGFLLGTCIAFFVVIGDLGPQIISKMLNKNPEDIRTSFLLTTGAFIVFPLGLLKNIDSLASICTATIGFYICLVLKVVLESTNHIFKGDWYEKVNYWRPAGILQCLPIFSMALFCQTQLFEIYESILNVSLEKMNLVVRGALNICTMVYLCVGFFGYVAFCTEPFSGNILMVLEPSATSDMIKIGFVLSVVFSFPLVIFPCRASLNSLLFKRVHTHEQSTNYIPETCFKCLTFTIVTSALITGILMPNIEFVLGLVGSTIGVMICLILPATCFIVISTKNTNERLLAQVISFVGIWIMILGTYANLYAMEEASVKINVISDKPLGNIELNMIKDKMIPEAIVPGIPREKIEILAPNFKINAGIIPDVVSIPHDSLTKPLKKIINPDIKIEPALPENLEITQKSILPLEKKIPEPKKNPKIVEQVIKQDQQANEILINSEVKKTQDAGEHTKLIPEANEDLRQDHFLKKLEEHKDDIRKLMEEQKVLLQDIEHHKEELEMEKKKRLMDQKDDLNEKNPEKIDLKIEKNPETIEKNPKTIEKNSKTLEKNSQTLENIQKNSKTLEKVEKTEEIVDQKIINDENLKISKDLKPKETQKSKNSDKNSINLTSVESRGPIVDVLTNSVDINNTKNQIKVEEKKNDIHNQLPIPLKLINQTKDKSSDRDKREVQTSQSFVENNEEELNKTIVNKEENHLKSSGVDEEYQISKKRDLKSFKDPDNL